jgi:hypothetical protein
MRPGRDTGLLKEEHFCFGTGGFDGKNFIFARYQGLTLEIASQTRKLCFFAFAKSENWVNLWMYRFVISCG